MTSKSISQGHYHQPPYSWDEVTVRFDQPAETPDLSAQIDAAEGLAEALKPAAVAVVQSALKEQLDRGDLLFRAKEALRRAKHDHERALMTEGQERSDMVTRHVAAAQSREKQIRIAEHNLQRVRDAEGLVK